MVEVDFGGENDVVFERRGCAGLIRLTRPAALNALTHGMVRAMRRALTAWEADPDVALVIVEGEGRAFCAGGDVAAAYRARLAGTPAHDFFAGEYRLNAQIKRYTKPYVAFLDGIVMGGGAGISVHGSHRIVTENTLFAMPEVGIGFFPDVGASAFLPHLPGRFGIYLALTGTRIRWGDCLGTGIATHAIASQTIGRVRDMLIETGDVVAALSDTVNPDFETDGKTRQLIVECFAETTVEACIAALQGRADEGSAAAILKTMESRSPTSLCVTSRQMAEGRALSMDDCMRMEYRIVTRMLAGHDFYEGVRAALIDKGGKPRWQPARLADVLPGDVDAYFAPLGTRELTLP